MKPTRLSPPVEAWKANGRFFEYTGNSIFYHSEGQGPALLCIHGFPTSCWDWHRVWTDLARRFHLIAADMLGFAANWTNSGR